MLRQTHDWLAIFTLKMRPMGWDWQGRLDFDICMLDSVRLQLEATCWALCSLQTSVQVRCTTQKLQTASLAGSSLAQQGLQRIVRWAS